MKINIVTFIFALLLTNGIFAQKVDIDAFRIYVSNASLPLNYIPAEFRTYDVKVTGDWNNNDLVNSIILPGWDRSKDNPALDIHLKLEPINRGLSSLKSRVEEQKDKNGKVISSKTYYYVTSTNQGSGFLKMYGAKNELPKPLSKKELEKQEQKEKEQKEKETKNPFLKNVNLNDAGHSPADNFNVSKNLVYEYNLTELFTYTTSESTSSYNATKEYDLNADRMSHNHAMQFVKNAITKTNTYVAKNYAYMPVRNYVKFKELDSEKHPEYEMYKNATEAVKTIFSKMRYNNPISEIEDDLTPILEYFNDVAQRYSKDDKHEKKLKGASLYNIAKIYQYLDKHDKTIDIGANMLTLNLDKGDAEDLIEESSNIKRQLEFHKMKSRHIVPRNEAEKAENLGEEVLSDNKN